MSELLNQQPEKRKVYVLHSAGNKRIYESDLKEQFPALYYFENRENFYEEPDAHGILIDWHIEYEDADA